MKELTTITNAQVTTTVNKTEKGFEQYLIDCNTKAFREKLAADLKAALGVDDVTVSKIACTVTEHPERKKYNRVITQVASVKITEIQRLKDKECDEEIASDKTKEGKIALEAYFADLAKAVAVKISRIQHFAMDIKSKGKKK